MGLWNRRADSEEVPREQGWKTRSVFGRPGFPVMGENSRLVVTGDLEQADRDSLTNGLLDFLDKFRGKRSSSIGSFEFNRDDIQREDVVKEVLQIYSGDDVPGMGDDEEEDL